MKASILAEKITRRSPGGGIQHGLQSVQKVRGDAGRDRVAVVDLADNQRTD